MSNEQTIEHIELNITAAKELVELGTVLERLTENPDFKTIITEGYFKSEAHRLVMVKSSPAMMNEKGQKDTTQAIDAIGGLYQYFLAIQMKANMAHEAITTDEEMIEELVQEDLLEAEGTES